MNFDDLMVLIMDYYEEHERKLDVEESFLDIPLVEPVVQEVSVVVRPQSPAEQLQALSALTNFSKKLNTNSAIAQTPKRVRVMQTQDLV